ncbi:myo-inositol-1(or 4)-monophosphatase [Friedmanniella endophytica]|uniref:Histidinol-phosphatase n=1 Tax=Microlunatus kandeliicorticis TaxID=1759536 RepID=A0A7W3IRZ4_9ACTN|nr:inositol monophosphatase [Microlunatus kandeliicorticis]MBA8794152.1 myo-inositol-1(or 4)-monophosphatase [Microlunatus kandeliicorticis]
MSEPTTGAGAATPDVAERLAFARELITEAGALALSYAERVGSLDVSLKGPQDLVSEADVAVEKLIKERLAAAYPDDGFLGEETGAAALEDTDHVWVVDPIDGTQPFTLGFPTWCVSIGVVSRGRLAFGLVNAPAAGELFVGGHGVPATLNDRPIRVRDADRLTDGLTYLGHSSRAAPEYVVPVLDRLLRGGGMFVRNGSGALGLCDVAAGRLVGLVESHMNSYDCLGGIAVVQAAGGRVNDYLVGDALTRGNWIVAGPPGLYDTLVEVLGDARLREAGEETAR